MYANCTGESIIHHSTLSFKSNHKTCNNNINVENHYRTHPRFLKAWWSMYQHYCSSPQGSQLDTSQSDIAPSCSSIWTMVRWADCSLFCVCFRSFLPESLCFFLSDLLDIFSKKNFQACDDRVWYFVSVSVKTRAPSGVVCRFDECRRVLRGDCYMYTLVHEISSITDIFVETQSSLDFMFFLIRRAEREHHLQPLRRWQSLNLRI